MKRLFSALLGDSAWLVLLVVAAIGAWFYIGRQHARGERDQLANWAEVICAGAGSSFAGEGGTKSGTACRQRITILASFKANTDQITAKTLADALAAHDARQLTDNQAARSAAEAARDAAHRMETADAEAERRNLVDRDWTAAVNNVAGLRPAPAR